MQIAWPTFYEVHYMLSYNVKKEFYEFSTTEYLTIFRVTIKFRQNLNVKHLKNNNNNNCVHGFSIFFIHCKNNLRGILYHIFKP